MSEEQVGNNFPPRLAVGARVWTESGYREHGPLEGPKVDIPSKVGGMIVAVTKPYYTIDNLLYTVRWDSGLSSKHYGSDLLCIGKFLTFGEFRAAIVPGEPINVLLGPQGGFREAQLAVTYDGQVEEVHLFQGDRNLWVNCIEPIARERGLTITETRLPSSRRKKVVS